MWISDNQGIIFLYKHVPKYSIGQAELIFYGNLNLTRPSAFSFAKFGDPCVMVGEAVTETVEIIGLKKSNWSVTVVLRQLANHLGEKVKTYFI